MPFRIAYDANRHEPVGEYSVEMCAHMRQINFQNMSEQESYEYDQWYRAEKERRRLKFLDDLHSHFVKIAGAKPNVAMSVSEAKAYVRLRAANSLRAAFETMELILKGGVPLKDQMAVAEEIIKRAVGPATALNSIRNVSGLTEMAPVDAIDAVMKAYGAGEVSEEFVKTLLGLLGAKVNGLKIEQELDKKSAQKMGDKLKRPPSGKVV